MNFDEIFQIMAEAFPSSEIRTYEGQKKLLENDRYHMDIKYAEDGTIIGFLAYWDLPSCTFFEHLAVAKNFRGRGLYRQLLFENIEKFKKPFIFEVEIPETKKAQQRINFYKRMGLFLNDFHYEQPALRPNESPQPLLIMSYPDTIDEQNFIKYKREIYNNVYGQTI